MKTALLASILSIILLAATGMAQPPDTLWTKTYGGNGADDGYCIEQTNDGGFIVVGLTSSYGAGLFDIWLLKLSASGDTIWTRTYGGDYSDYGYCVRQTSDGGYIVGAAKGFEIPWPGSWDAFIIKTDAVGDSEWTTTFGGDDNEILEDVQQSQDGGYIALGNIYSPSTFSWDFFLAKLDESGDSLWSQTYGGGETDQAELVEQTPDGGYLITATTSSGTGYYNLWLIKTNAYGEILWEFVSATAYPLSAYDIQRTIDGGYILMGRAESGAGNYDVFLTKMDALGNELWSSVFGGANNDEGVFVRRTGDGGYILTGYTESFGSGSFDLWLVKTDSLGSQMWSLAFGGSERDFGHWVCQTADGGHAAVGFTESFGAGEFDVWLIRLEADTTAIVNTNERPCDMTYALYPPSPNPFNPSTVASYELRVASHVNLQVYDTVGKLVRTLVNGWRPAGRHEVTFDGTGLAAGIYLCRMEAGKFMAVEKMVLLK